jgi:thymidylate kinase
MANLIILEGLSRTGKSTITKTLSEKLGLKNISLAVKKPEGIENLPDFYHGIHVISNEFYKEFKDETFILDRSFLSELVYSKFFERNSHLTKESINDIIESNNVVLFFLNNDYDGYIERGPKEDIPFTENDFSKQKAAFEWNFSSYKNLNEKTKLSFIEIDTTKLDLDKSIDKIETHLKTLKFI